MDRQGVSSSTLLSVGYDATSRVLQVEFVRGDIYEYVNVPQVVYDGLMAAASHGAYFDANVRRAGYAYRRV